MLCRYLLCVFLLLPHIALAQEADPASSPQEEETSQDDFEPLPPDMVATRWGQIQGLMAGITFAHAIQPIAAAVGDIAWKDKYYVSIAGAVLYGTAFVGHLFEQEWSLYIALIGPAVGLTAVLTGWILYETEVSPFPVRPDAFQLGGGVLQLLAWLIAYQLLTRDPQFHEEEDSSQAQVFFSVGTTSLLDLVHSSEHNPGDLPTRSTSVLTVGVTVIF